MKRKITILIVLELVCAVCFAQTAVYRYAMISNDSCLIVDMPKKIPDEKIDDSIIPMNTAQERFVAEYVFKELEEFFYSGLTFAYADATESTSSPNLSILYTWTEVMDYVRGIK